MINSTDKPLITIITPVFNSEKVLNDTIRSVVDQQYTNWELLLIDDFSTDDSRRLIESWARNDRRIKPHYLKQNVGAGEARNVGLKMAKGDYIAFLDSDDMWVPEKLQMQINVMKANPKVNFLYTWYTTIDENGNRKATFKTPSKLSFAKLKFNNYILTSTVIYNRNKLSGISFSSMRKRQDWVFFLDLLKEMPYAHALPKVTVFYRKMPNTLSSKRFKLIKPNFNLFREYFYNGNFFLALIHFMVFLPFYFHNKILNKQRIEN